MPYLRHFQSPVLALSGSFQVVFFCNFIIFSHCLTIFSSKLHFYILPLDLYTLLTSSAISKGPHYCDPFPVNITPTVLNKILMSSPIFHSAMYFVSSATTSSKSVMLLLPLICHIPVSPGLIAILLL